MASPAGPAWSCLITSRAASIDPALGAASITAAMRERSLNPSEAAKRLGVSTKALRLYERHGLLKPIRTAAGWRDRGCIRSALAVGRREVRAARHSTAELHHRPVGQRQHSTR